jgi:UDP-glucose 4-epimerase
MSDRSILITGGAGYIGSHTVLAFREAGYDVVVLDDLSGGSRALVPTEVPLVVGDGGDRRLLDDLFRDHDIQAVVHLAGSVDVAESVAAPLKYYRNNTCVSRTLIEACVEHGVERFIFSSTAAVYGAPVNLPVSEQAPAAPINPYGRSKLMTEWLLADVGAAHALSYAVLRYFNVAGADGRGRAGQTTAKATHLIKVACEAATGRRDGLAIFGGDYDTPDGTCVRDYLHVSDLATAHVAALDALNAGSDNLVLNCGYGRGHSVREVLQAVEREAGVRLQTRLAPRRPGDAPILVADATAIRRVLQWRPENEDLGAIVRSALTWEKTLATGVRSESSP